MMHASASVLPCTEFTVLGAGVIGLSLALELRLRGATVTVIDRADSLGRASTAAAGMLAVEDPHNPPELRPFSELSRSLYPSFLDRVQELSGLAVPFQTDTTLQWMPGGDIRELAEHSIDPRQLAPALSRAAQKAGVRLIVTDTTHGSSSESLPGLQRSTAIIHTTGAWGCDPLPVFPRKGQMLRVAIPRGCILAEVHRAERVYVVPRTLGPQAGTALLGATVEDVGFDASTQPEALRELRRLAAGLVPAIAEESAAPLIEAWAGLRPATPDNLPILGRLGQASLTGDHAAKHFVATGHFRNGILLAPATAVLMADLLEGKALTVNLEPFSPERFAPQGR